MRQEFQLVYSLTNPRVWVGGDESASAFSCIAGSVFLHGKRIRELLSHDNAFLEQENEKQDEIKHEKKRKVLENKRARRALRILEFANL